MKMQTVKQVEAAKVGTTRQTMAVTGVPGLQLQISPAGAKSWQLRFKLGGKARYMGLGTYPAIGLAEARDAAIDARRLIAQGTDPVRAREAERHTAATFADAIDGWERDNPHYFKTQASLTKWLNSLRALTGLGELSEITSRSLWDVFEPIAEVAPDKARRVRGRVAEVLDWAADNGLYEGDNPADAGYLKRKINGSYKGFKAVGHPALQVAQAPAWLAALRAVPGTQSRALEFMAYTVARSGEVRGALWTEIDLAAGVWTLPPERTKTKVEHMVPLSGPALALLEALPKTNLPLVFPAKQSRGVLNMNRLLIAMQNLGFKDGDRLAVPHGLRATFRTWAGDNQWPRELAEYALAHNVGGATERAYNRSKQVENRRPMMEAWAVFLEGQT